MSNSTEAAEEIVWESRAHVPITVVTVVLSFALLAVGLRTYARAVVIRQFGLDDYAAIIALLFAMGSGIMVASNTIYGAGHHMGDPRIDWTQFWKYLRTFYISIVLYNASLTAIKLTFLLQYYRVLTTRKMRLVVICALVFVAMWSISQLLIVIFTCTPIEAFWLGDAKHGGVGTCMPNLPFWYINAAGNILTDVMIFVIPLPALGSLNLRRQQKLALIGVFCLGFFTCAISIIRIQYLKLSDDTTWDNVDSSCWSVSELASGIICSCLPTLRPLLSHFVPSMGSRSAPSHAKYVHHSSGRDNTEGSSLGTRNKSGKFGGRSVVYPEDVELQTKSGSQDELEKHAAVIAHTVVPAQHGGHHGGHGGHHTRTASKDQFNRSPSQNRGPGAVRVEEDGYVPPNQLGLQPTVRTEVRVGSQQQQSRWTRPVEGAISVKHDLVVTQDYN